MQQNLLYFESKHQKVWAHSTLNILSWSFWTFLSSGFVGWECKVSLSCYSWGVSKSSGNLMSDLESVLKDIAWRSMTFGPPALLWPLTVLTSIWPGCGLSFPTCKTRVDASIHLTVGGCECHLWRYLWGKCSLGVRSFALFKVKLPFRKKTPYFPLTIKEQYTWIGI